MNGTLPKTVGRYQILDRVAVGGMAELYKAQLLGQHGFEKLVAIKKILPHLANDRTFVDMFIDEARITGQLDHRNIVAVFELGTDADTPYIAMQYVDGLDVLALLRECARTQIRLPPDLAALIAREVLEALDYAHKATDQNGRRLEVIHRDISPGNVLLSWRGDVKLTDFGIASAVERQHKTEAGTLKGKYGYMSPEQVSGAEIDSRSDLFSTGILLAEMVMARRLFTAPNDLDILLAVRDARVDRLREHAGEFPDQLRAICVQALQRRPERRWNTAAEFRDDIDNWLRGYSNATLRDLAEFMATVAGAPTADVDDQSTDLESSDNVTSSISPSGTGIRMAKADAEIQALRAAFVASFRTQRSVSESAPLAEISDETSAAYLVVDDADVMAIPDEQALHQGAQEVEKYDLAQSSVVRLVHQIAKSQRSGLLTLSNDTDVTKRIFFGEGQPQYIHSSVTAERFGEFLVAQQAISQMDLQQALMVLHKFDGRLADTLVALGMIKPLDAYRLFAKQVATKLTSTFAWGAGTAQFTPGFRNPWKARPLHLDSLRVIGAGSGALDAGFVESWEQQRALQFVFSASVNTGELEAFGLGDALGRVHSLLDGQSRLRDLLSKVRSSEARLNLLRLVYLLVETELAHMQ
jgi:eukaryotic-like serine/threonine-protein kinase